MRIGTLLINVIQVQLRSTGSYSDMIFGVVEKKTMIVEEIRGEYEAIYSLIQSIDANGATSIVSYKVRP